MTALRPNPTDHDLLALARDMCAKAGGALLYLCRFGARLYGLERPDGASDTDLCGLYAPAPGLGGAGDGETGARAAVLLHSTSSDRRRNGPSDLDIELHPWPGFADKLARCEVKALDLAFSPGNRECVLFRDPGVDALFEDPGRHLDASDLRALWAYVQEETGRYGMPGSRRAVLWRLNQALPDMVERLGPRARLAEALPLVLEAAGDARHCRLEPRPGRTDTDTDTDDDGPLLQAAGKLHPLNIRLGEFRRRIGQDIRPCLPRLSGARQGTDIDWKAVSHAVRALRQHRELLTSGRIVFPYEPGLRRELMEVKLGRLSFEQASRLLDEAWAEVRALAGAPSEASF